MIFHLLQYGSVQRLEAIAACRRARRAAIAAARQVGTLAKQFPKRPRGVRPSRVLRPAAAIGRRGLALGGRGRDQHFGLAHHDHLGRVADRVDRRITRRRQVRRGGGQAGAAARCGAGDRRQCASAEGSVGGAARAQRRLRRRAAAVWPCGIISLSACWSGWLAQASAASMIFSAPGSRSSSSFVLRRFCGSTRRRRG